MNHRAAPTTATSFFSLSLLASGLLLGCEEPPKVEKPVEKPAALVTEAPPDPHRFDYKKPTVEGKVFFKGLKDGDKVKGKSFVGMIATPVEFGVEGMTVAEEGPVPPNTGHFYAFVDAELIPEGAKMPTDSKYRNFAKGETSGVLPLAEGKHTITVQFADGRNRSYGPAWASSVKVVVSAE
jgi:Domain of unknown function (DUF4399)